MDKNNYEYLLLHYPLFYKYYKNHKLIINESIKNSYLRIPNIIVQLDEINITNNNYLNIESSMPLRIELLKSTGDVQLTYYEHIVEINRIQIPNNNLIISRCNGDLRINEAKIHKIIEEKDKCNLCENIHNILFNKLSISIFENDIINEMFEFTAWYHIKYLELRLPKINHFCIVINNNTKHINLKNLTCKIESLISINEYKEYKNATGIYIWSECAEYITNE